jgi:hypothetical protein
MNLFPSAGKNSLEMMLGHEAVDDEVVPLQGIADNGGNDLPFAETGLCARSPCHLSQLVGLPILTGQLPEREIGRNSPAR